MYPKEILNVTNNFPIGSTLILFVRGNGQLYVAIIRRPSKTSSQNRPLTFEDKSLSFIQDLHHSLASPGLSSINLRIFQHTPGTYPRPPANGL